MRRTTMKMTVASVLLIALFAVGCGTAQKATHEQSGLAPKTTQATSGQGAATQPSTPSSTNPPTAQTTPATPATPAERVPPAAQWELLSKWSDVQGRIVALQQANGQLKSLQLLVEKDFKTPTSPDTTPDFPFRVGSTIEIVFDGKGPTGGQIISKVGDDIVLSVGQFGNSKDEKQAPFWGSSLDRYWYKTEHKFYNAKGDVYKIFIGPELQQTQVYTS